MVVALYDTSLFPELVLVTVNEHGGKNDLANITLTVYTVYFLTCERAGVRHDST